MSVLIAQNLEHAWGADTVLAAVNLRLEWGHRLGLVGPNGSGKTTLLRVLAGDLEPDRGRVIVARGVRIGWLPQIQTVTPGATVRQEAEAALASLAAIERRMHALESAMGNATSDTLPALMEEYATLRDRYDAMGGHDAWRDVQRVLGAMGFQEADLDRPADQLSGGQKTRLALARMVLSGTEVLLLDEPTNHLDVDATEWLEGYLTTFGGALVVVSHDRRLLDNVVTGVIELDRGRLTAYRGSFSAYWQQREGRLLKAEADEKRRAEEIARLEEYWRRNKAGQNRNIAWSRYKMAERLRGEQHEAPSRHEQLRVSVVSRSRSGNEVLTVENLAKRYGPRVLFSDLSMLVTRGQRIGIVGPNGSGKTTFLRVVLGLEAPSAGSVRLGAGVVPGYFAQEASELDPDACVLDAVLDVRDLSPAEARSFLARWLFTGDDVFKRIHQLSGGERNRLVLAQLSLLRPNLLVLDEPTNHLDIIARDALARMLKVYDGTLLIASHDRYLLDEVTTHTLEIAGGSARLFQGSYSEYRRKRHLAEQRIAARERLTENRSGPRSSSELARMRRQAAREVARVEQHVQELEDWLKRIEECLSSPRPGDDIVRLAQDYERAQAELKNAMAEWEQAVTRAGELGVPI